MNQHAAGRLHACTPELVDLEVDGVRRRHRVRAAGDRLVTHVNIDEGQVDLRETPRFTDPAEAAEEGTLVAPGSSEKDFPAMHAAFARALTTGDWSEMPSAEDGLEATRIARVATESVIAMRMLEGLPTPTG